MWRFREVEPEPARGRFREELMTDPAWDAEVKYDGDRRVAQFCDDLVVRFTGRRRSVRDGRLVEKTMNLPHLALSTVNLTTLRAVSGRLRAEQRVASEDARLLTRVHSLAGTVLDGEVVVAPHTPGLDRGGRSKHVTSIIGSLPGEALTKQVERGWLRYVVFDCLWFRGADLRTRTRDERRGWAHEAVRVWANPYAELAETCPDTRNKRAWLDELWERGEEGIILKRRAGAYARREWVKVKSVLEADCIITGYEEARAESKKVDGTISVTKFAERGWMGALVCSQYRDGRLWECASVSGMDDALREEVSLNRKKFLGRVVTLKANAREPSGRFRHPQFLRFRNDKDPRDCQYHEEET